MQCCCFVNIILSRILQYVQHTNHDTKSRHIYSFSRSLSRYPKRRLRGFISSTIWHRTDYQFSWTSILEPQLALSLWGRHIVYETISS